jgi:hypothetical protein
MFGIYAYRAVNRRFGLAAPRSTDLRKRETLKLGILELEIRFWNYPTRNIRIHYSVSDVEGCETVGFSS